MLAQAARAMVSIQSASGAVGSGFLLANGVLVSSAHQLVNDKVMVVLPDGSKQVPRDILVDTELDLAIARVSINADQAMVLRPEKVVLGETVYALGNPLGLGLTATQGIVSAEPGAVGREHLIQTDAAINAGNSGGALIDTRGRVVGMVSTRTVLGAGIGFAVSSQAIARFVRQIEVEEP